MLEVSDKKIKAALTTIPNEVEENMVNPLHAISVCRCKQHTWLKKMFSLSGSSDEI